MCPKDADGMTNSVDPAQTALNWIYTVCPDLSIKKIRIIALTMRIYCGDEHGDLHQFKKKNVGRADFSDQFRKIIVRYKRIGYNINIMRQSACLVFNPVTVNNFASLFHCTPVGRASDSMMAST